MAFTQKHQSICTSNGVRVATTETENSGGALNNLSEAIPNGSTNLQVAWAAAYAKIKALTIIVSGACVIKTNSSGSPDNTLTFTSTKLQYQWDQFSLHTLLLTADVTTLYITNSSGSPVDVQIYCVIDPT